jgi:hypothetical protein
MKKTFDFIGTPSGDGESFCFAVDRENFYKATDADAVTLDDHMDIDFDFDEEGMPTMKATSDVLKVYPDRFFPLTKEARNSKWHIKIELERLGD